MRFDNHLGLKHADAESLLLCCLKRTEQRTPQECRTNPASIISDGQNCPTVALTGFNSDFTSGLDCVSSVKKQVGDYAAKLIPVHTEFSFELEILDDGYSGLAFQYFERVSNEQVEVHLCEFGLKGAQGADAADKLVDAVCGFTDPTQGVLSKGGIIKVHGQIL